MKIDTEQNGENVENWNTLQRKSRNGKDKDRNIIMELMKVAFQ